MQPHESEPRFRFFADLQVEVGTPQDIGFTPRGRRRLVPITGGSARGEGWQARVLPGGADFQLFLNDTLTELDARYVLELDGGDLVYVKNHAIRCGSPEVMARLARGEPVEPSQVYFKCSPSFETASPLLAWTAERLFIGNGMRLPTQVVMRFFELL